MDENGKKVVQFVPSEGQNTVRITYWMFLKNPRAMMASISSMFSMIFMLFFDSILSDHLKYEQKVDENAIGYFFALVCLTYAISSPFIGMLTKVIDRKYVTCSSFFIATISLFMFGPSKLLKFGE